MGTHTPQCPPAKVESKAFDFMQFMRLIVSGSNCDRRFIINMDQTPVYYTTNAKKTLIRICSSTNDMKRVTMAVTIMADDTLLLSTLVYKGKPNGKITTKAFPSGVYSSTHFYKCQEAAWMDEAAPYIAAAPDHVIPILILDMYQ